MHLRKNCGPSKVNWNCVQIICGRHFESWYFLLCQYCCVFIIVFDVYCLGHECSFVLLKSDCELKVFEKTENHHEFDMSKSSVIPTVESHMGGRFTFFWRCQLHYFSISLFWDGLRYNIVLEVGRVFFFVRNKNHILWGFFFDPYVFTVARSFVIYRSFEYRQIIKFPLVILFGNTRRWRDLILFVFCVIFEHHLDASLSIWLDLRSKLLSFLNVSFQIVWLTDEVRSYHIALSSRLLRSFVTSWVSFWKLNIQYFTMYCSNPFL